MGYTPAQKLSPKGPEEEVGVRGENSLDN